MGISSIEHPSFVSHQVSDAHRFYLDLNPPKAAKLAVVCGGWERCSADYRIGRNDFPYYCIEYVADGQGMLSLGNRDHVLHRGIAFAYGPRIPHAISTHQTERLSKYYVDFLGVGAVRFLQQCGIHPGDALEVGDPERIELAFARLIQAGATHGPNRARITLLQLEILLLELSATRLDSPAQNQSYQTFIRCRDYIDQHFLEIQTAEEAADACHLDPAYLSRLFTKYAKESPYRYLLHKKMTHAADLLDGGQKIVREVAAELGMDPFHFSRVFKRVLGVSPSDFSKRRDG
jgi:AraC-like DNA-binding protein